MICNVQKKCFLLLSFTLSLMIYGCQSVEHSQPQKSAKDTQSQSMITFKNIPNTPTSETENNDIKQDAPIQIFPSDFQVTDITKALPEKGSTIVTPKNEGTNLEATQEDKKICQENAYLNTQYISSLYQIYLKQEKSCLKITNPQTIKHFSITLANRYTNQDIRILNADNDFMNLYATAIKASQSAEKVMINKRILEYGCHLLKAQPCALVKKSLY